MKRVRPGNRHEPPPWAAAGGHDWARCSPPIGCDPLLPVLPTCVRCSFCALISIAHSCSKAAASPDINALAAMLPGLIAAFCNGSTAD